MCSAPVGSILEYRTLSRRPLRGGTWEGGGQREKRRDKEVERSWNIDSSQGPLGWCRVKSRAIALVLRRCSSDGDPKRYSQTIDAAVSSC